MIKISVHKMSNKGWTKHCTSVEEAFNTFNECICKSCKTTDEELAKLVNENPNGLSGFVGCTLEESGLEHSLPDNWQEWSSWEKIQILLSTPCGLEYEVTVEDECT